MLWQYCKYGSMRTWKHEVKGFPALSGRVLDYMDCVCAVSVGLGPGLLLSLFHELM